MTRHSTRFACIARTKHRLVLIRQHQFHQSQLDSSFKLDQCQGMGRRTLNELACRHLSYGTFLYIAKNRLFTALAAWKSPIVLGKHLIMLPRNNIQASVLMPWHLQGHMTWSSFQNPTRFQRRPSHTGL